MINLKLDETCRNSLEYLQNNLCNSNKGTRKISKKLAAELAIKVYANWLKGGKNEVW